MLFYDKTVFIEFFAPASLSLSDDSDRNVDNSDDDNNVLSEVTAAGSRQH